MARYAKFFSVGAGGGGTNNLQLPVGTILDATLRQVQDGLGTGSPLYLSTRRVGITSDSSVTTQTSSVIQATTSNANLVIAPNGTGALIADIPDGTVAGGNARGNYSVDLQMNRTSATQVAGGISSVISGGELNRSSGYASTVGGGNSNTSTGNYGTVGGGVGNSATGADGQTIVGGQSNTITGSSANGFIGGGTNNSVSSSYSTISGGQSNTASAGTHATVVGGFSNTASGQYAISGGNTSTASGTGSVALGQCTASGNVSVAMGNCSATGTRSTCIGFSISASGQESVSLGGQGGTAIGRGSFKMPGFANSAAADYSISQGSASSYLYGQAAYSPNSLNGNQTLYSNLLMSKRDTLLSGGSTVLSLDGTGVTNLLIPGGQRWAWNVTVKTIAVVSQVIGTATGVTAGDCWLENETILFKRVIATSSIVNSASDNIMFDASMTTCSMAYTVGASGELKLTFTGPTFVGGGSVILHVASKIELTEVQYT